MQTTSHYNTSFHRSYRGCHYDSLLELKYALSIEDDFHFLREYVFIWYDAKDLQPKSSISHYTKLYKPDFLIRNKKDNKAYLVEVKPLAINRTCQLSLRTTVAQRYIEKHKLDWQFTVVYDNEISLNGEQQKRFDLFRKTKNSFLDMLYFENSDVKFNQQPINLHKAIPYFADNKCSPEEYIRLVKFGTL